jgi:exoribonuclease II
MFVVFEEDGGFKLGRIIQDQMTTLQVESLHGKRIKVKRSHVLLEFKEPDITLVHSAAEQERQQLDAPFLWETCPPDTEFSFSHLAEEYYGRSPTPSEALAMLETLHGAPMYFYRKGKGHYRSAPEASVKAALAGQERKKLEAQQVEQWSQQLQQAQWPAEWPPAFVQQLLYKPDRQQLYTKAFEAACEALSSNTLNLLRRCKQLHSSHDYHLDRFLYHHFPNGSQWSALPELDMAPAQALLHSDTQAFSIDDASTTEIDDAFSLTPLNDGCYKVGIHIAVPALAITPKSEWDQLARTRYSTVYMPGHKITMLPDTLVQAFSLNEGNDVPALSLYVTCQEDGTIIEHHTQLERIHIAANLRLEQISDAYFDQEASAWGNYTPYADALKRLHTIAEALYQKRGKPDGQRIDFQFQVDGLGTPNEHIQITPRQRGSRIDRLVSEWMIFTNTTWSGCLAERTAPAFYRVQAESKVRTSSHADRHQGLNLPHYMWSTSPLRRYADLANQQQLLALVQDQPLPYAHQDSDLLEAISQFDLTYSAYGQFQDQMESYWCLRWLKQEQITRLNAKALVREGLFRLETLPLVVKTTTNAPSGTRCILQLTELDEWAPHSAWQVVETLSEELPLAAPSVEAEEPALT